MKVVVLGASGFVGKHLVRKLQRAHPSYDLVCFSYVPDKLQPNTLQGDVLDALAVERALQGADVVFHLVAAPGTPEYKYRVIVEGTRNVVAACQKHHIKKLVFLSSYATSRKQRNNTGEAKKAAEDLIKHSGISYTFLRPTLIYGKGGRVFEQMKKTLRHPLVPLLGKGNQLLAPLFVEDMANILVRSLAQKHNGKTYELLGERVTYKQLLLHLLRGKKRLFLPLPLSLVLPLVRFLHILRILPFDERRVLRAAESIEEQGTSIKQVFGCTLTPLEKGLTQV